MNELYKVLQVDAYSSNIHVLVHDIPLLRLHSKSIEVYSHLLFYQLSDQIHKPGSKLTD